MIIGPTASGKTALAVETALALRARGVPAEVISADSVQVYRGLDVGSAKPTAEERRGVAHRLIDVRDPRERYSVKDWLEDAEAAIGAVRGGGGVPIVAGGTHLYIKALLEGLFEGPEPDEALRAELRATDPRALREELERVDPAAAGRIHPADVRRTVRALEVHRLTGRTITEHQTQWDRGRRADAVVVAVRWPTAALNRRINARVRGMMEAGFLEEVRALEAAGALGPQAGEALGYKQLAAHLRGACALGEAVERIKIETRRFAKNQRTWIRRLGAAAEGADEKNGSRTGAGGPLLLDGESLATAEGMQLAVRQLVAMILNEG